jgi:hypothetical protein
MTEGSAKCESPGANFCPSMVCARRRFGRKRNWLLKREAARERANQAEKTTVALSADEALSRRLTPL